MKLASVSVAILFIFAAMGYKAVSKINPAMSRVTSDLSRDNCVEDEFNYTSAKECHCYLFQSAGRSHGSFKSPNFPRYYPINLGCILYIFVGALDELVELTLYEFDMRPRSKNSQCHDYFRLFLNLDRPEVNEKDRWDFNTCGSMQTLRQSVFYSRHRVIIAELHTTGRLGHNYKYRGFKGNFKFVKRAQFKIDGQRVADHPCHYQFDAKTFNSGSFFSPNYPQNYPNSTSCVYEFSGKAHQRVIIDFASIRLEQPLEMNKGKKRCDPMTSGDRMVVYDGPSKSDRVLGRFCGQVNTRQVVSHGNRLTVHLYSDGNGVQAQGFAGHYQFVNRHTVQPSRVLHDTMRGDGQVSQGAACIHEYRSDNERKSGFFELPQMPYEVKTSCLFSFRGQPDERVTIDFRSVRLDDANPRWCRSHTGDRIEIYDGMSDAQKWLEVICGHVKHKSVTSSGPSLTVKFIADDRANGEEHGFEAQFAFVTERSLRKDSAAMKSKTASGGAKRPSSPSSSSASSASPSGACRYQIFSRLNAKTGVLQTPGYPDGFRKDLVCYWLFYGEASERVRIKFLDFSLNKEREGGQGLPDLLPEDSCAGRDRVQLFKFYYQEAIGQVTRHDAPVEFCGDARPRFVMSGQRSRLDVIFQSVGGSRDDARGVRFQYMFVTDFGISAHGGKQKPGECVFHFSGKDSTNGSFTSPNYPGNYPEDLTCDYIFKGHAQHHISILFRDFDVSSMDTTASCNTAPGDYVEAAECYSTGYQVVPPDYVGPRRFCRRPRKGQTYRIEWPSPCLQLRFHSNSVDTRRGFLGYYSFYLATGTASANGRNSAHNSYSSELLFVLICLTILRLADR